MRRALRRLLVLAVGVCAAVAALLTAAPAQARAQAPPWGACGTNTDEQKLVRDFLVNPRTNYHLRCGGPVYSSTPAWGYRHILWRHRGDFERLAAGTGRNWRDLADLTMDSISRDPDVARPAGGNQGCLSRVLFLHNLTNGQLVRQQIFRMYVDLGSNNINTVHPASTQCP